MSHYGDRQEADLGAGLLLCEPPCGGRVGGDGERDSGGGMPEIQPQHTIFLSHSGFDKGFVQNLNAEFEKVRYFPFFDQREHSLPFGEEFEELIDKAAKNCLVAVIVLSRAFVTSKWPMKELASFVKARGGLQTSTVDTLERKNVVNPHLKLYPLFYKLNPDQLKDGLKKGTFWKELLRNELESEHGVLDPGNDFTQIQYHAAEIALRGFITKEAFNKALKEVKKSNGLRLERFGNDEVKFIREAVKGVLHHVPRQISGDMRDIRGCKRLCEEIENMFVEKETRFYLGLYGRPGVGKSTVCCEAMSDYLASTRLGHFRAYCSVRLENDKGDEDRNRALSKRMERIKSAIHQLVGLPKILSKITNETEARKYLSDELKKLKQPVLMVVDNVTENTHKEAEWYGKSLCSSLPSGSYVILTSRSRGNLETLLDEACCLPFPPLKADESEGLFLDYALPAPKRSSKLHASEVVILKDCLSRCVIDEYYIPRLLSKLAFFLHESTKGEIISWGEHIADIDSILGLEYDKLDDMSKLIFLDLAVFAVNIRFTHLDFHSELEWDEHSNYWLVVDFIAMLHDINRHLANKKVKELQNVSLFEESRTKVAVSESNEEFARDLAVLRHTGVEKLCMVCSEEDVEDFVDGTLRVLLEGVAFDHDLYTFQEWGTVQFLCLVEVTGLVTLDLHGLRSLRVLKVHDCDELKEVVCTCNSSSSDGRFCYQKQRGCLSELRVVDIWDLHNLKKVSFPEHCRKVESLWFDGCPNLDYLPDLRYCKKLKRLRLPCGDFNGFHGLSNNQALIELAFYWDPVTIRNFTVEMRTKLVEDVKRLQNLKVLDIVDESEVYDWIPAGVSVDVRNMVHLTFLDLSCASSIEKVEGLEELSNLTSLSLYGCCELGEVPDLSVCFMKLRRLCISHCHKLDLSQENIELFESQYHAFHAQGETCAFGEHDCLYPWEVEENSKQDDSVENEDSEEDDTVEDEDSEEDDTVEDEDSDPDEEEDSEFSEADDIVICRHCNPTDYTLATDTGAAVVEQAFDGSNNDVKSNPQGESSREITGVSNDYPVIRKQDGVFSTMLAPELLEALQENLDQNRNAYALILDAIKNNVDHNRQISAKALDAIKNNVDQNTRSLAEISDSLAEILATMNSNPLKRGLKKVMGVSY